jgi:nucleotide-binding universal stress UspA family protein
MIIEARDDTITLRGEVKSNIWPAIQAAAALLLENHPTGIILDGSGLTKITPKGAETFAHAFAFIASQNARIMVVGLTEEMLEIGKTVPGVRSQLPIASTVEEARSSLELGELTPRRGKARVAAVVPIVGNWRRAVYFADKLACGENCEVHLVDLIKVPRTLPLGSPLPEREAAGQARLEEAQGLVRKTGLKSFSHVERVRSESGLEEFADRLNADFAVLSIDRAGKDEPSMEEAEALSLQEATTLELSIAKGAPAQPTQPPANVVIPATGAWYHAVEHACKLVAGEDAQVTVVYVTAIPRTEALDTPKPDAEAEAADCAKEALRIGKKYGVKVIPTSERVRDPVLGFAKLVEAGKFDLAVVGVKRETSGDYHVAHATAVMLLDELPCETIFLRTAG